MTSEDKKQLIEDIKNINDVDYFLISCISQTVEDYLGNYDFDRAYDMFNVLQTFTEIWKDKLEEKRDKLNENKK